MIYWEEVWISEKKTQYNEQMMYEVFFLFLLWPSV